MNAAQVHLMLNHVPVLGVLFVIVTLAAGLWTRKDVLLRFGFLVMVAIALAGAPVYFSGEGTEEAVEHKAGVTETTIERHEDLAKVVSLGLAVFGVAGAFALVRYRRRTVSTGFASLVLATAVVLGGGLAWTAHLGGQIRHDELRGSPVTTSAAAAEPVESEAQEEEDDHD